MVYIDEKNVMYCEECEKRCYSKRDAGSILNSCKHHRSNDRLGRQKAIPRRMYWCTSSGHYHLTSMAHFHTDESWVRHENSFYRDWDKRKHRSLNNVQ